LYELFQQETIEKERLILLSMTPSAREHLDTYNLIDIALDTFPYNGTTTTCEAMWMGVPVITLAGQTHASRVGVSLLSNVGLPDLIVNTKDEYVDLAIMLANDLNRLKSYQKSLREKMAQSPLCDTEDFTLNLEIRFRKMWETWCQA
jgi:predicted O-linked N-acetylglucosamine transferase (SPINDLY family)